MERIKRRILSTVVMHHFCNDASVVALPSIFPILHTQKVLIKRYSDIGTILLIGLAVAIVSQLIIGHRLLVMDAAIVGVSLLLMTLSRDFITLVIFFIGVRIGTSVYHPVGISWISHTFKGTRLDRAMGFQSAFGDIGVLAAFALTGLLAQYYGWRAPLFLWGIVNLAAVAASIIISRGTEPQEDPVERNEDRVSWGETFGRLRTFIPVIILGGMAWGVTLGYAPSLFNHRLGISMSQTGIIMSCWMAAGAIVSFMYGKLAQVIGRYSTIMVAYVIIVLTSAIIGLSSNTHLTIGAFILYGMALFITYPAILSFVGSTIDAKNRTAAFSLVSTIQIAGISSFAYISGFLSDSFGINTPFLLLGCVTLLSVTYLAFLIRTKRITAGPVPPRARPKDIVAG